MMIEVMKEIVSPMVKLTCDEHHNKLILEESDDASKIKKLHITHFPSNSLAFTLDYKGVGRHIHCFKQFSSYVNSTNGCGVNKGCDLVVIWEEGGQTFALIFDLKSDKPKLQETSKQLKNSELFVNYLLSLAQEFYETPSRIVIKKTIVVTDERATRKRPTYPPNNKTSQVAEYRKEVVSSAKNREAYVSFNQLIGK